MQELPISPRQMAELMKLAQTEPGKRLLSLLQKEKGPELRQALSTRDYEEAKRILLAFTADEEVKTLLRQLGR